MFTEGKDFRQLPWFDVEIEEVPEPAKTILEQYSRIPSDRVLQHVRDVVSRG